MMQVGDPLRQMHTPVGGAIVIHALNEYTIREANLEVHTHCDCLACSSGTCRTVIPDALAVEDQAGHQR